MEWALTTHEKPAYKRERDEKNCCRPVASERLSRLPFLPCALMLKASAISAACLSPLDYSPIPTPSALHPLKLLVKKAFGLAVGAPEIVLNMWGKFSLDPDLRWIIASVRLLRYVCTTEEGKWMVSHSPDRVPGSRLSALRIKLTALGWSFDARYIYLPEQTALGWKWDDLRDRIVLAYKTHQLRVLEERRPGVYAGILPLQPKKHAKMLLKLSTYQASIMMRIWTGCALTA